METIARNLNRIREYTRKNPSLMKAHHFIYDLRLNPLGNKVDFIVMGINPGEADDDHKVAPKPGDMPLEETSESDFHNRIGLTPGARRWRRLAKEIPGSDDIVLAECFFWSSANLVQLVERYGPLRTSPHLKFCTELNEELIRLTQPRAIIFPGLMAIPIVTELYGLHPSGEIIRNEKNHRIVVPYHDGERYWLFTKHWSGARLANVEKKMIQQQIKRWVV